MIIFKQASPLTTHIQQQKKGNKRIGFVPTMGALHDGHLSLIQKCKEENDICVCSIFVNPTQFNNRDDFKKYPVTIESDIEKLTYAGCDILFYPAEDEVYTADFVKKNYDLGYIEEILEGRYRPGHFQGVCQIVDLLLKIVLPENLYLGQKDYQQCMVVKRLLHLLDKQNEVTLKISETVRESDGLAMSSRNLRLNGEQREKAKVIFKTLNFIKDNIKNKETETVTSEAKEYLHNNGFVVDYVEVRNADDLREVTVAKPPLVALVAATIGDIRLIDNLIMN